MSRTIIEIDNELLAEAAAIFKTKTKSATVNAALQTAVNQERRREFADWLIAGGLPGLTEPAGSAG